MKKITIFLVGFLTAINLTAFASTFTDEIQFKSWNKDAIYQMKDEGLMNGYADGSFGPDNFVTRGELATILKRLEDNRIPNLIENYLQSRDVEVLPTNSPEPGGKVEASIDDDAIRGDKNAPVTMIEFTDFECPFCSRFHEETLPLIQEKYINTGKVRLVLRDFPLEFHPHAKNAAMAAECVKAQGGGDLYWQYADLLFEHQADLEMEQLKTYAKDFPIDQNEFAGCLDAKKTESEVDQDREAGIDYGVQGTPTFFINQKMISGAQDYNVFEEAIEAALIEVEK